MQLIFDTNTLLSAALLMNSVPYKAYKKAFEDNNTLLRSEDTLAELEDVITRPKFNKYFKSEQARDEFFVSYIAHSVNTEVSNKIVACRDPKDNKFLELALSGNADLIISGDNDLLVLNPFRGIPIITSSEFLKNY